MVQPGFEPARRVLPRHEYAGRLRFRNGEAADPPPLTPSAGPAQLHVHVPFCESLCPFCSFHWVLALELAAMRALGATRHEADALRTGVASVTPEVLGQGSAAGALAIEHGDGGCPRGG